MSWSEWLDFAFSGLFSARPARPGDAPAPAARLELLFRELRPTKRAAAGYSGAVICALRFGLILALAALAACDRSVSGRADLVVLNGAEPETLDPHLMTGQLEQRLAYALYEGLVYNDENGEIRPGLAREWEISPDGKTYTFHLREGATWSNGDPVTAQNFVDS